jgi:predicted ATPase
LTLFKAVPESPDCDRQELEFLIALRAPLAAITGMALNPGFEARSERATILAEKLGDVGQLYASLHGASIYFHATGKYRKARELAERCRSLALRQGDRAIQVRAHHVMGLSLLDRGEFAASRKEYEQLVALYDPERERSLAGQATDIFVAGSAYLAWALWISGHPERAAKIGAQALGHALRLNHVFTIGWVHIVGGAQLEQLFGNVGGVMAHTEAYSKLMSEHAIYTFQGFMTFYKGWALSSYDGSEVGIALMQQGLALLDAKNVVNQVPYFMSLLAQIHARAGDVHSALATCGNAQQMIRRTEERTWLAEVHRVEGEVRRIAGHPLTDVEDGQWQNHLGSGPIGRGSD